MATSILNEHSHEWCEANVLVMHGCKFGGLNIIGMLASRVAVNLGLSHHNKEKT